MFIVYTVLCVTFFISKQHVDGIVVEGVLITHKNWVFVERFCFLPTKSKISFTIKYNDDPKGKTSILLYNETPNKWPSVYTSNRSCEDKQSILSSNEIGQCSVDKYVPGRQLQCVNAKIMTASKPSWWFFVLADCSSRTGLNVTYKFVLTNEEPGGFWRRHFSADEVSLLPKLIGVACGYVILLACSIYVSYIFRRKRLHLATFETFLISEILQMFGVSCEIYSFVQIAIDGEDDPGIAFIGSLLEPFAETIYTMAMLLLALGCTVTKSELAPKQIRLLLLFVFASLIYQTVMIVFHSRFFDPAIHVYLYDSLTGQGLLALKILAWCIFASCCYRKKTTTKYRFYVWLVSLGSAWYLVHPLTVIFVNLNFEDWRRKSFTKSCSLLIGLLGHAVFLYVMQSLSTNIMFPIHIRTIQVMPAAEVGENYENEPQTPTDSTSVSTISEFTMSNVTRSAE